MAGTRILLKIEGADSAPAVLGAAGSGVRLQRLFTAPASGPAQAALAAGRPATWYVAEASDGNAFGPSSAHPWDAAHAVLRNSIGLVGADIVAAEPDLEQDWVWYENGGRAFASAPSAEEACKPDGQKAAPFEQGPGLGWHLDPEFSGLRAAREEIGEAARAITIVHLDTGYDKEHSALPENLAPEATQRNFVEGINSAVDQTPPSGLLKNRGHGTGTIGILAGGKAGTLVSAIPVPPEFGYLGGAPLARIVPVRVANSVVHFGTSAVAQGIDYAREIKADVLSMSMGGLPSAAWADAVNAAYEAGVVLVCAAGNSFGGLPTSLIVYPARFARVIAACGVMAKYHPYYGLGGPMEGNVGPASKMSTAMAAYTPNIPWMRIGCPNVVDMDGAGTSSATPQIAAAAALWLAKHGSKYERSWQRVEAARAALFGTADRRGSNDPAPNQYFGRGLLRAGAALGEAPAPAALEKTKPDSASFAFLHLLSSVFGVTTADPKQLEMFQLELTQLALTSRGAREAVPDPGLPADQIPERQRRRFFEAILDDRKLSMALRNFLEGVLGRPAGAGSAKATVAQAAPSVEGWGTGAQIRRRRAVPAPSSRRLRVFATDPGDSRRLATSFINIATIEVLWETMQPGPVGEYIEVVDVDPASDAAYDPIDLDDRHLLAQDGHAPSEGNPQFHQQMAYAVAMRTIRNFEVALGRRALWAERRMPPQNGHFVAAPDGGYVQRLRIYPHALRERNAFYSPDKKALLFGYFGEEGASNGRRTIFTCLSQDVVAHETTHALLDGLHRRYQEPTNPDVLAFHEAFADIVAIFQHFTFPELLRYEIGRLRGDLAQASLLSDLARQFGQALHNKRALRRAIDPDRKIDPEGEKIEPLNTYADAKEPHERGAILVAAVFEAFVAIYTRRTQDLFRIATAGTGVLVPGAIHPDLVERLAQTAVETAQRILTLCIRALDYMPPVDPTFGDYLRAIVTADADFAPDRGFGYRVAFAEAFTKRGVYPPNIASVAPDSLLWQAPDGPVQSARFNSFLQQLDLEAYTQTNRRQAFQSTKKNAAAMHKWLADNLDVDMAKALGLDFRKDASGKAMRFEVHSVRPARRTTAAGEPRTDIVAVITQQRKVSVDRDDPTGRDFTFRGGSTLLLDREYDSDPIRYAIARPVWNDERVDRVREFVHGRGLGINALYGEADEPARSEPFAVLHSGLKGG